MINVINEDAYKILSENMDLYNKNSKKIYRFPIFDTRTIIYSREGHILNVNSINANELIHNAILNVSNQQNSLSINLNSQDDINWFNNTILNMNKNQENILKILKEYTKPEAGLFIYDETSDKYYINKKTGSLLLKSKEISKSINIIKWNSFKIFKLLRNLYNYSDFKKDLDGLNSEKIINQISEAVKNVKKNYRLLFKIESFPKWHVELHIEPDEIMLMLDLTSNIEGSSSDLSITSSTDILHADIKDIEKLKDVYQLVKIIDHTNEILVACARRILSQSDPRWYIQNTRNNNWYLTEIGKDMLKMINIEGYLKQY
ncbi:hypothetical protein [Spiroplasma endosymbiont of Labia minor]|uniref:hypothetical protein n=1 Tax=Spiroplasma endosymbiont of Labia minor TaxID=3066305 RepID=UPI0030CCFEA7